MAAKATKYAQHDADSLEQQVQALLDNRTPPPAEQTEASEEEAEEGTANTNHDLEHNLLPKPCEPERRSALLQQA